jgi:hypothetical protein
MSRRSTRARAPRSCARLYGSPANKRHGARAAQQAARAAPAARERSKAREIDAVRKDLGRRVARNRALHLLALDDHRGGFTRSEARQLHQRPAPGSLPAVAVGAAEQIVAAVRDHARHVTHPHRRRAGKSVMRVHQIHSERARTPGNLGQRRRVAPRALPALDLHHVILDAERRERVHLRADERAPPGSRGRGIHVGHDQHLHGALPSVRARSAKW